jgi:hypothetical protein
MTLRQPARKGRVPILGRLKGLEDGGIRVLCTESLGKVQGLCFYERLCEDVQRRLVMSHKNYLFTSESVTEGHPDKMCDQISDAIVDAIFAKEAKLQEQGYVDSDGQAANVDNVRCAIETFTTTGTVVVMGEVRTEAYVDVQKIVRETVAKHRLYARQVWL